MMKDGIRRRALFPLCAGLAGLGLESGASAQQSSEGIATIVEPGVHRVMANTTIKGDLLVKSGASIDIAAGCTLTLLGSMIAPITPIFTGAGLVDLNRSRLSAAHPEWWGARPGDGRVDSLAAMQLCLRAHPIMHLLAADYYISDTLVVDRAFSRVFGSGFRGTELGQGTRIIVTNGSADVLRVGPATKPATVADFTQNIEIRALALCRSKPVSSRGSMAPAGLRAQFLLFALFEQVSAFEHGIGIVARGLVRSTMRDCVAFRSTPGADGRRPYRGFLLDGSEDIGLAGGNASLYLQACNATIGGAPDVADSVGLLLDGAFADCFVIDFEATALECGIRVDGMSEAIGARGRHGHANLHLRMPIVDQCSRAGVEIRDTTVQSVIDITGPYVAVAPTGQVGIQVDRMRGSISISGGQVLGGMNSAARGAAVGLEVRESRGIAVHGLKIVDHAQPVRLADCSGFALHPTIMNTAERSGGAAILIERCEGGSIAPLISADRSSFSFGVALDDRSTRLRVDCVGVAPQSVGVGANRVSIAGKALSAPFRDANIVIEGP